ncbi:helicase-exonuclease AddAB subunit AddA [Bombilactobacillus folatiphilus]|uniref:ATP-dependent helicase/nuclease subunit A n=1 Tax=Bombilactobacillus folatiphilus TaxID=2923362 RepID=A0ABY4P6Z0_9LACO|nr:helicase-exonuclease AddAB subunit AddA [Bombilactobacillus folatiphilus]UQS81498.1 helicase-exonuclease AddAB subunit AddA [Bombilactobacillus folatiphilus]
MAKFKPTAAQQQALTVTGSDVLVSASAGAGKTTILVDRIVQQLQAGEQIDHLLIVTFTEAAAKEMKQRLAQKIQQAAMTATGEQQQHLRAQLSKLPTASISTLHAFCLQVIRKFYYLIDLDPNFRLLSDDNERFLLQERAWQKVRNTYYQAEDTDFLAVENNFATGNDDQEMENLLFKLTNVALTNQNPKQWLSSLVDDYQVQDDLSQMTFYQEQFVPMLEQEMHYVTLQAAQLAQQVTTFEELANYADSVEQFQQQIQALLAHLKHYSWDQLRQQINHLVKIKGRAKAKTAAEIMEPFKQCKKRITQIVENWQYKYFVLDNEHWRQILQNSGQMVAKLIEVEQAFLTTFQAKKRFQHSLDFNDLEHYALKILQADYRGKLVARDYYHDLFGEILIDEYQDTNPLQEAIIQQFKRLEPGNLYMVGDVKQAIYGFRQADPALFTHKYRGFQQDSSAGQLVNLTDNFRSHTNVLATVNAIFAHVMDERLGDVQYDQAASLKAGSQFPSATDAQTEFWFVDQTVLPKMQLTSEQLEIQAVIRRIKELQAANFQVYDRKTGQLRTLRYGDIAILTRVKSLNNDLIEQFAQSQLPIVVHDSANYFQASEVQTMLSMLKIIDNPRQDIALVAVLRSAIVGLDENELAYLRINQRSGDYYQALSNYLANDEYNQKNQFAQRLTTKVQQFMTLLTQLRTLAPKISLAELIWQIYLKTGYLSYVQGMPNGKQRVANLHALYQRATEFEQLEFKGLFQFIHFIEHIEENEHDLARPVEFQAQADEIQAMTIHGSKGLEFPIVFVLNLDHSFNAIDVKKRYLLDAKQGLGIRYLDPETRIFYETLPMAAIKAAQKNKLLSEEIRLLYVALTRAQQKLILVGSTKVALSKAWDSWQMGLPNGHQQVLDLGLRSSFKSFQDILEPILALNGILQDEKIIPADNSDFDFSVHSFRLEKGSKKSPNQNSEGQLSENSITTSPLFKQEAQKILNFQYPQQAATQTTAYQSVSEIKHLFANPDDQNLPVIDLKDTVPKGQRYVLDDFKRPRFLSQEKSQVKPADVGSATHLLLQKINLDQTPKQTDFVLLAQQLVQQQVFTQQVMEQINFASLAQFYQSNLGQQIIAHQATLQREWAFSMVLPADQVFTAMAANNDQILIHGIIDGLFSDEHQQITLFDYKTDYIDMHKKTGPHSVTKAIEQYSGQLNLYQKAAEQIMQQPVQQKFLCLLSVNQIIKVN